MPLTTSAASERPHDLHLIARSERGGLPAAARQHGAVDRDCQAASTGINAPALQQRQHCAGAQRLLDAVHPNDGIHVVPRNAWARKRAGPKGWMAAGTSPVST